MNDSAHEPTLRRLNLFEHARYETFLREEWHGREAEWIGITRLLYMVVSYLDNMMPSRVLDLCPGSGLTTVELARLAGEVHGPGWHLVAGARSKEDQQAVRESVAAADVADRVEAVDVIDPRDLSRYPDGHFDVVLAPTIFQDVLTDDDRHLATSEISRILRDDGWAVFIAEMCKGWTLDHNTDGDPPDTSSEAHRHNTCFSTFSDIGGLLDSAGLSFSLGDATIYIGLAKSVADEVWSHLRQTDETAFDEYLIELEDRDTGQRPEGQVVDLIIAARKWTLEKSREIPGPAAKQKGQPALRTLTATQVLDLRAAADGWRVVNVSVGPNNDPILLLAEKAWANEPEDGVRPPTRMRIAHVGDEGTRVIELPEDNVVPYVQPLGPDRWLAVYRQAINEQGHSACIYDADGLLVHTFHAGFWGHQVQTTKSGKIWVSYADMGTYRERNIPVAVCFDAKGDSLLELKDTLGENLAPRFRAKLVHDRAFLDCYALNVDEDDAVWLYLYSGFPLVRINAGVVDRFYRSIPVRGSSAFAVHGERVLFAGRYLDFETVYYVSLRSMAVEPFIPVDESGKPITFNRWGHIGRGSRLYLVTDEALHMIDLADVRP